MTTASNPPINLETLGEFYDGDQTTIDTILRLFATDLQKDFEGLSTALAQRDAEHVHLLAHRIKGSAGIVGASRLVGVSALVEAAAKANDWAAIERETPRFTEAVYEISAFLAQRTD